MWYFFKEKKNHCTDHRVLFTYASLTYLRNFRAPNLWQSEDPPEWLIALPHVKLNTDHNSKHLL